MYTRKGSLPLRARSDFALIGMAHKFSFVATRQCHVRRRHPPLAGDAFVNQPFTVVDEGGSLGFDAGSYRKGFLLFGIEILRDGLLLPFRWECGKVGADADVVEVKLGAQHCRPTFAQDGRAEARTVLLFFDSLVELLTGGGGKH